MMREEQNALAEYRALADLKLDRQLSPAQEARLREVEAALDQIETQEPETRAVFARMAKVKGLNRPGAGLIPAPYLARLRLAPRLHVPWTAGLSVPRVSTHSCRKSFFRLDECLSLTFSHLSLTFSHLSLLLLKLLTQRLLRP